MKKFSWRLKTSFFVVRDRILNMEKYTFWLVKRYFTHLLWAVVVFRWDEEKKVTIFGFHWIHVYTINTKRDVKMLFVYRAKGIHRLWGSEDTFFCKKPTSEETNEESTEIIIRIFFFNLWWKSNFARVSIVIRVLEKKYVFLLRLNPEAWMCK